jgi:hypothetical protein
MEITDFKSLLSVGREQSTPQRFLFVFLQAILPDKPSEADKQRFESGQGGELKAIMCVDKNLSDLTNFADLVTDMTMIKHPFRGGVKAQVGIEF